MWQTRTLASFTAATVAVEPGTPNELLDQAQRIGLPSDDNTPEPATTTEPKTGSYEAFMATFGSPRRWAGR